MESPHKHPTGITHAWHALRNALKGYRAAWRYEDAFRQELVLAIMLIIIALWLDVSRLERLLLIVSVLLVLILELVNSAIEAAVDHTSLDFHPLAGRAKDMAGAAVFTSMLNVMLVWGIVLLQND